MRTFGGFKFGSEFFYGEVRGEDVEVLAKPYWIHIQPYFPSSVSYAPEREFTFDGKVGGNVSRQEKD